MDNNISSQSLETKVSTIETTLGELIETITNMALESGRTEEEAYLLVSCVLNDVIVREQPQLA